MEWRGGYVCLPSDVVLQVSSKCDQEVIDLFADLWDKFTLQTGRITPSVQTDSSGWSFALPLDGEAVASLSDLTGEETYRLDVSETGIVAKAKDRESLIHAMNTFLQLLAPRNLNQGSEQFAVPYVSISDWPASGFRGLHICVFPETKPLFLNKVLRLAGLLKFSHVVLEFWGTLQLETMKELSWPNAMSKQEAGELIQLARHMGLEVIPMFNSWGHGASSRCIYGKHVVLDQNPRLATLFEPDGWTWCLTNRSAVSLLKEVIAELSEFAGPGKYFHLGCDEADSHATCDRCREHEPHLLFSKHVNELTDVVLELGRRPIIWGDALLDAALWEKPTIATSWEHVQTHRAIDEISRDVIIADWQYDKKSGPVESLEYFISKGFDVLTSPWSNIDSVRTLAQAVRNSNAMGMLVTTWDNLPRQVAQLFYCATACWTEDLDVLDLPEFHAFQPSTAGHYTRVLSPSKGDYHDSGWAFHEVFPWLFSGHRQICED